MENIKTHKSNVISNIIAIINYKQKNYCIYTKENHIAYALIEAEKFKFDVDVETTKVLNEFYNLIKYNKEYGVFCGNYKLNHNEFMIYQDLRSKLYTFILKKDNKRYLPSTEDTKILNSYFNNDAFIFFEKNQQKTKEITMHTNPLQYIKKVLKIGSVTAVILISATFLTYNLPQNVKNTIDYEMGTTFRRDLTKTNKSYTFEDIQTALKQNDNISEEDKLFIENILEDEFEENKEYMNISKLIKKIKTLEIQYDKYYTYNKKTGQYELTHGNDISSNTAAYYNSLNNKITCIEPRYNESQIEEKKDKPFGFNEIDKSTYYHELNHMFTSFYFDAMLSQCSEQISFLEVNDYIRTNTRFFEAISDDMQKNCNTSIFRETINEIFTQEYIDKYYQQTQDKKRNIGYFNDLSYMYCLAEILPIDVLREYKFNDNDSIITEGLLHISNNKTEAYTLMTSLRSLDLYSSLISRAETNNNIEKYFDSGCYETQDSIEAVKQIQQEQAENYKRIHDGFAYFYKAKYNKEMSDDMNMLIYLFNTPILTDAEKQKVVKFLNLSTEYSNIQCTVKGYFSKTYIENHPYTTIEYIDKDLKNRIVTINEKNRYIDNYQDIER